MSDTDTDAPSLPHLMALRTALFGVALGAIFIAAIATFRTPDRSDWIGAFTAGLLGGVGLSVSAIFEARWRAPTWRDAFLAAAAASSIAFVATFLAVFEIPYALAIAKTGSPRVALESLQESWQELQRSFSPILGLALAAAPICGVAAATRRLRAGHRLRASALAPALSAPGILIFHADRDNARALVVTLVGVVGCAVAVPLLTAAADALEHRLRARA